MNSVYLNLAISLVSSYGTGKYFNGSQKTIALVNRPIRRSSTISSASKLDQAHLEGLLFLEHRNSSIPKVRARIWMNIGSSSRNT